MNLCASKSSVSSSLQTIIGQYETYLISLPKNRKTLSFTHSKGNENLYILSPIAKALTLLIRKKTFAIPSHVLAKLLSVIERYFWVASRGCKESRTYAKARKESGLNKLLSNEETRRAFYDAKELASLLSPWLDSGRQSFSSSICKKIPKVIFNIERFEHELDRLLEANKSMKGFSSIGDIFQAKEKAAPPTALVTEEVTPKRGPKRKRQQLRSRNRYIDAMLEEEEGDDAFADLEDFIVCKKGKAYK